MSKENVIFLPVNNGWNEEQVPFDMTNVEFIDGYGIVKTLYRDVIDGDRYTLQGIVSEGKKPKVVYPIKPRYTTFENFGKGNFIINRTDIINRGDGSYYPKYVIGHLKVNEKDNIMMQEFSPIYT